MAKQTINIGTTANDGTGDPIRAAFGKVNDNFTEIYTANTGVNTGDQNLSAYATTAAVAAGYQPLDSDLTAISALTTTAYGRALLSTADAATLRSAIGVGTTDAPTFLRVNAGSGSAAVPSYGMGTTGIFSRASVRLNFNINGTDSGVEVGPNLLALSSTANINWTSNTLPSSGFDLSIYRDAAGILAQRDGLAKQTLRIYNTYTSASIYERAVMDWNGPTPGNLQIGTEFLGSGSGMAARPIDFVTGGVVRMSIAAAGAVSFGAGTASAPTLTFGDSGTGLWRQTADRIGISASGTNMVVVYNSGMYMASGAFGVGTSNWLRIGTTGLEVTTTSGGGTLTDLKMRNIIQSPGIGTTVTPANNSELVFETTSNTSVTVKLKGSDGTVRSFALTLV